MKETYLNGFLVSSSVPHKPHPILLAEPLPRSIQPEEHNCRKGLSSKGNNGVFTI